MQICYSVGAILLVAVLSSDSSVDDTRRSNMMAKGPLFLLLAIKYRALKVQLEEFARNKQEGQTAPLPGKTRQVSLD